MFGNHERGSGPAAQPQRPLANAGSRGTQARVLCSGPCPPPKWRGPPCRLQGTLSQKPSSSPPPPQNRGSGSRRRSRAADFLCDSRKSGSPAWASVSLLVKREGPTRTAGAGRGGAGGPGARGRRREAARPARRSVEGLEGLALQRGLDPADPALAGSSADVPRGRSPAPLQGRAEVSKGWGWGGVLALPTPSAP